MRNKKIFTKGFKKRFWNSFWVFFLLLIGIYFFQNRASFLARAHAVFGQEEVKVDRALFPKQLIPIYAGLQEFINKKYYLICYDESIRQPRFTFQILVDTMVSGNASRSGIYFKEKEDMNSYLPQWSQYSGSGMDRGHLVPAADYSCCQELLEETFTMANVAPFDSTFNRNAWVELEQETRKLARKHGKLWVITGPVLGGGEQIGRTVAIPVPIGFFKVIYWKSSLGFNAYFYFLPNHHRAYFNRQKSIITADKLEKLTGLDFFVPTE